MKLSSLAILAAALSFGCGGTTLATLKFVGANPASPAIGQGSTLSFEALDNNGLPLPGVTVSFSVQGNPPNVSLSTASALSADGTGIAQVTVTATARVSTVTVVAKAGGITTSGSVSFAGALAQFASARNFTFQCGQVAGASSGGIHAIGAYDPTRNLIAGVHLTCSVHVADNNGDAIAGAPISFLAEAGTIAPSSTTIADSNGNADVRYVTSFPLPQPVDPGQFTWTPPNDAVHTGDYLAPLWMAPYEWSANPTLGVADPAFHEPQRTDPIIPSQIDNPRDNLVTLIAVTTGQEAFEDLNGNGTWDPGEPFQDTTEPFVDANDNGTWDPGELFIDVNGNGRWDGKNGKWDANTQIWAEEKVLWTGLPAPEDTCASLPCGSSTATVQIVTALNPVAVPHFGTATATFFLSDPWFNTIARNGAGDGCVQSVGSSAVNTSAVNTAAGIRLYYPPGERLTVTIRDAHDPNANPQPSADSVPVNWTITPMCQFTSSPDNGDVISIPTVSLSGSVT